MKVLVLGRGKTGALVAEVAKERGHDVLTMASQENQDASGLTSALLRTLDAAIDFTTPNAVLANIKRCVESSVPIVVGTTGWNQHMEDVRALVAQRQAALLYGTNFSISMNLFFRAVQAMAPAMNHGYRAAILEKHHALKKDKPSGTALTLQKTLESGSGERVEIASIREGDIVSLHVVTLDAPYDTIVLTHDAKSRLSFAEGAVRAAEWIKGRTGFYEFPDVLDQLQNGGTNVCAAKEARGLSRA